MHPVVGFFRDMLEVRLRPPGWSWLQETADAVAAGVSEPAFARVFSQASRCAGPDALAPDDAEQARAAELASGWSLERWRIRDALRATLLLSRPDLAAPEFASALEALFTHADEGELCALYRCLFLLPAPERFAWRAGEGCRTNMRSVFEAAACDGPFPRDHFDDVAWRQLALKAIFIDAPLWRVVGIDERVDEELARMALDFADERRSAGRPVPTELWLCLGGKGGERGLASLRRELDSADSLGRRAAALGLARAGHADELRPRLEHERDPEVRATMTAALAGACDRTAFRALRGPRS